MSREIKFRAWSLTDNIWVYGSLNSYLDGKSIITNLEGTQSWFVNSETVGQYTGLKDKNGKEIYEGDILKTPTGIGYVIWDDAAFAIKSPGSEAVDWEHSSVYNQSVIIGNIHQNSELLKGDNTNG